MHWTWILVLALVAGAGTGMVWYLTGRREEAESLKGFDFDRAKSELLSGRDS